ncbi:hypothetical protein [Pyrobaculum calidifontis]|uniref:Uncharacterized protein n=1 Tax=Pyrobaculum calidifontis (strain DSM 21063 / JCM 11548 / VA1) TaxID=410359 RepID=A3MV14_PYRCJ|nr:hypothetical protein [Pyrobaculum calidifontis]ABO08481.1 conserved hypothetical protein [Pyrobaculum calidifontis JCM 11548]
MEFSLSVVDITSDFPNVIKLSGDVEATVELPLEKLGVALKKGDKIRLVLSKEKDGDLSKYKVYMWGIVYHVAEELTRISIGGLQLDIKKKLPLAIGEKVYIGIL